MSLQSAVTGHAAGVPFVAVPPTQRHEGRTPTVVAWHLMAPPRTESAFAAALPLEGLNAWRIYLGLPMHGSRSPEGGPEELLRLAFEDAVLNVQGPVIDQAAGEFEPALDELRERLDLPPGPLGLVGGSAGAAVAQLVLTETAVEVAAAVLVSPLVVLSSAVEAMERHFGVTYSWSDAARDVARRLDFVTRADELAGRSSRPAILIVVGEQDDAEFRHAARQLHDRLHAPPDGTGLPVDFVTVADMGHALADEPGLEPAPQTAAAAKVDDLARQWFERHLVR